MRVTYRTLLFLAALAGAIGPFAIFQSAYAQDTANISVRAVVTSALTLTACDTSADFGSGLSALGSPATGTQDQVMSSDLGDSSLGQGTIYFWIPSCPAGQPVLTIETTVPWELKTCAMENSGSSSLSVAAGDLGWSYLPTGTTPRYDRADQEPKFTTDCSSSQRVLWGPAARWNINMKYTLRVDPDASGGTFITVTTWMLVA